MVTATSQFLSDVLMVRFSNFYIAYRRSWGRVIAFLFLYIHMHGSIEKFRNMIYFKSL